MDPVDWTYAAQNLAEARRQLLPADDEVDALVDAAFKVAVSFAGVKETGDRRIDERLARVRQVVMLDDAETSGAGVTDRARWRDKFEQFSPRERTRFAETVADLTVLARQRSRDDGPGGPHASEGS